MPKADPLVYLNPVMDELAKKWPENRTVNIACHGHSVPAGYFATPYVNAFDSYPHLLHRIIKERFPFAVTNVIVTAIGGENSLGGEKRLEGEVLNHNPSAITLDYALNDRGIGLDRAEGAWRGMIEKALARGVRVILVTPSWETAYFRRDTDESWGDLLRHNELIHKLADEYGVGLADAFSRFAGAVTEDSDLVALLSHGNHPNAAGHRMIAEEIGKFFLAR